MVIIHSYELIRDFRYDPIESDNVYNERLSV